jgi:MFS family permease
VGIALPVIGREFGASAVQLSLVQTAQVLAISLILLPMGRFADIHGRKRIFLSGTSFLCVSTLILGFARTIEVFIVLRFIQGIGVAMIFSTSIAILTAVFPPGQRGRAMGVIVAMVYLGMAAGPSISGFIIEYLGWRWVFFLLSGIMAAALILTVTKLKGEPFDWAGSAVFMLSLFLIIYGATELTEIRAARWIILAGLAGMALFFRMQWHSRYPILDIHLLTNNLTFTFSNLATFINYAATYSFIFFFCLYLQYVKGIPPKYAGLLLIIQPLVQAVLAPMVGRLSDSFPPSRIATMGMFFCTIGLFIAGTIDAGTSFTVLILVTIIQGISLGLFSTPNMTAIMECVEPRHYGTASSMVATMRTTGILASTTIIAMVFSFYMGHQPVTEANLEEFLNSQQTSFYLFSALSLVGTIFSMVKGRLAISISK